MRASALECPSCGSQISCPECKGRLVRHGHDYTLHRQRYFCRPCDRHTTVPYCPICSSKLPSLPLLSESGRRCLICGQGLSYCPRCGYATLTLYGKRSWERKGGKARTAQMYKCKSCGKITSHPTCDCDSPHMSEAAICERDARKKAIRAAQ